MRVALATTDGKFVSRHFGHCPSFCIVEIDESTLEWRFIEQRANAPACGNGEHSSHSFAGTIGVLSDCNAVFVAKVGPHGRVELERCGIQVLERAGFAEDLLNSYVAYLKRQARFRHLSGNGGSFGTAGAISAAGAGGAGGAEGVANARATGAACTAANATDTTGATALAATGAVPVASVAGVADTAGAPALDAPAPVPGAFGFARQKGIGLQRARYRDLANDHPCFSQGAHGKKGRLHLPVSGHCNIRCRFCTRAFNSSEQRPGVSNGILPPGKALAIVAKALELCPDIRVIGIAGPGDSLASPAAIDTFAKIHEAYPGLIKCLSTNGLALPGKANALRGVGVRSVTVTVNAVDPEIAGSVVSYIVHGNRAYIGKEAGEILVGRQLAGIREAAGAGMAVKVNTVLIPPVNGRHIADIAKAVASEGAIMHNIIPLLPQNEFAHIAPPSCEEIENARAVAGEYMPQFRHCAHCRADACGVPGISDFSGQLYSNGLGFPMGHSLDTFSHG